jgi:hypothetical protein
MAYFQKLASQAILSFRLVLLLAWKFKIYKNIVNAINML